MKERGAVTRGGAGNLWLGGPRFMGCEGWGLRLGGLGDGSPPVGSRGEAPVGGLGVETPQKLKHFLKKGINFYQK